MVFLTPYYRRISPREISGEKSFIRLALVNIGGLIPSFIKKWATKIEPRYGQEYLSVIPSRYFTTLSKIKFYGIEFRVPSNTEEYLTYRYGKTGESQIKTGTGQNKTEQFLKMMEKLLTE